MNAHSRMFWVRLTVFSVGLIWAVWLLFGKPRRSAAHRVVVPTTDTLLTQHHWRLL